MDDNATNSAILERQLQASGVVTTVAPDATSALALLREALANETLPDLALFDRQMPGIDGLQLVGLVAADRRFDALPIVMLTSAGRRGRTSPIGLPPT